MLNHMTDISSTSFSWFDPEHTEPDCRSVRVLRRPSCLTDDTYAGLKVDCLICQFATSGLRLEMSSLIWVEVVAVVASQASVPR